MKQGGFAREVIAALIIICAIFYGTVATGAEGGGGVNCCGRDKTTQEQIDRLKSTLKNLESQKAEYEKDLADTEWLEGWSDPAVIGLAAADKLVAAPDTVIKAKVKRDIAKDKLAEVMHTIASVKGEINALEKQLAGSPTPTPKTHTSPDAVKPAAQQPNTNPSSNYDSLQIDPSKLKIDTIETPGGSPESQPHTDSDDNC